MCVKILNRDPSRSFGVCAAPETESSGIRIDAADAECATHRSLSIC